MEYKKVEIFVPNDSQPHLCSITTNDYQTQIEWLEPIEESEQDELWDIIWNVITTKRMSLKELSNRFHLIKK